MPRRKVYPPLRGDYWPFATKPTPCGCEVCEAKRSAKRRVGGTGRGPLARSGRTVKNS